MKSDYSAVPTEFLNKAVCASSIKGEIRPIEATFPLNSSVSQETVIILFEVRVKWSVFLTHMTIN